MQIAALAQGNEPFHNTAQILCLGQSRLDLFVFDQGRRHIGKHGGSMAD
jgi:hypothetical protein